MLQPTTSHRGLLEQLSQYCSTVEDLQPPTVEEIQASCGPDVESVFDTAVITHTGDNDSGHDVDLNEAQEPHTSPYPRMHTLSPEFAVLLELDHNAQHNVLYYRLHTRRYVQCLIKYM